MAVLQDLTQMTREQLIEAMLAKQSSTPLKVTDKGGISMRGFGRYPVTLYASQWERLIAAVPELKAFMAANTDKLARKE